MCGAWNISWIAASTSDIPTRPFPGKWWDVDVLSAETTMHYEWEDSNSKWNCMYGLEVCGWPNKTQQFDRIEFKTIQNCRIYRNKSTIMPKGNKNILENIKTETIGCDQIFVIPITIF